MRHDAGTEVGNVLFLLPTGRCKPDPPAIGPNRCKNVAEK